MKEWKIKEADGSKQKTEREKKFLREANGDKQE